MKTKAPIHYEAQVYYSFDEESKADYVFRTFQYGWESLDKMVHTPPFQAMAIDVPHPMTKLQEILQMPCQVLRYHSGTHPLDR